MRRLGPTWAAQAARDESPEAPADFDLPPPFESADLVSEDLVSEDLVSEDLVSEDLVSEDFVSEDFASDFDSLELSAELSAESDLPVSLLLPLSRKSVTYHPSPFRWNAAALISFLSLSFPQEGHLRFGLSLNFWMNSCCSPHPSAFVFVDRHVPGPLSRPADRTDIGARAANIKRTPRRSGNSGQVAPCRASEPVSCGDTVTRCPHRIAFRGSDPGIRVRSTNARTAMSRKSMRPCPNTNADPGARHSIQSCRADDAMVTVARGGPRRTPRIRRQDQWPKRKFSVRTAWISMPSRGGWAPTEARTRPSTSRGECSPARSAYRGCSISFANSVSA